MAFQVKAQGDTKERKENADVKRIPGVSVLCLSALLWGSAAWATPLDLRTFTAHEGVSEDGGIVTFIENIDYSAIYFYDDRFEVPSNATTLSFDYWLALGQGNDDWLVAVIDTDDSGFIDWPDDYYMEIGDSEAGSWSIDLTGFRGQTVFLGFGLESNDWDIGTVATISNLDLESSSVPVPEPCTIILVSTGLVGLFGTARKKKWIQCL